MNKTQISEAMEMSQKLCTTISELMSSENEIVRQLFESYWWDMFTIQGHMQQMNKLLEMK
jgi:hypothetical protein